MTTKTNSSHPANVSLHTHTEYSIKDGVGTTSRLVQAAASKKFEAVAITDHGTLGGTISFSILCEQTGVKPIIGLEGYVTVDGKRNHITLLADGNDGFAGLVNLSNLAHRKDGTFTISELLDHQQDLICLTGCIASPFHALEYSDAIEVGRRLKTVFGPRLFGELMFVGHEPMHERVLKLCEELKLKPVLTNDVHFPLEEDGAVHSILMQMKAGFSYYSDNLWLKSAQQIADYARSEYGVNQNVVFDAAERATKIARKIKSPQLKRALTLPHIENANIKLRDLIGKNINRALITKKGIKKEQVYERLTYELEVIESLGFESYFLILHDIVENARRLGVTVGPGRGSGAGSLALFALGITNINPLDYDLSFDRFLNRYREDNVDVDVDFDSERRHLAISYAVTKFDAHPVVTYSKLSHKVLVRDLARYFKLSRDVSDKLSDELPGGPMFRKVAAEVPEFEQCYWTFRDQVRHRGKHAGGIIITDNIVPLENTGEEIVVSWDEGSSGKFLSEVGVVKFDILGLSALSIIQRLEEHFGKPTPELKDGSEVFELFEKGDLLGIFQFSASKGIRELSMQVKPKSLEEVAVVSALFRPGALDVGLTQQYVKLKDNPRKIHPLIDPILESTGGIVCYQEQMSSVYAVVTDGSIAEADLARRVIMKPKPDDPKWIKEVTELKRSFIKGCIKHGMLEERAGIVWTEITAHSHYSFNKSHAVSYSKISCDLAYYKYYHPTEFFTALLNVDRSRETEYIFDATVHNIEIRQPHVNVSGAEFTSKDNVIYLPLSAVKFLGDKGVKDIVANREEHGEYLSVEDFNSRLPKRSVNSRAKKSLRVCDAFVGLEPDPTDLILDVQDIEGLGLSFRTPSRKLVETIRRESKKKGQIAGVVTKVKKRVSKAGPYDVVFLEPQGVAWTRTERGKLTGGMYIVAKINEENGQLLKCKILK